MELTTRRGRTGVGGRAAVSRRAVVMAAVPLVAALVLLLVATGARAAQAPVGLGTAGSFAVLAGTTVTNTGRTVLTGDLGVDPGNSVTGNPTVSGATHIHDAVSAAAQRDLVTAWGDAAGRGPATAVSGDLVGMTLVPGVYRASSSLGLTGTVTLDAQGDPQAVFVVQVASTFITGSDSRVALINGGQACNVFWEVGSSATLGTGTQFKGNILALTSISAQTAATAEGRLLARNGAVTLDSNTITRPGCATPGTPTSSPAEPGPTVSSTPSATPTGSAVSTVSATPTAVPTVSATPPPSPSVLPTFVTIPPTPGTSPGTALPITGRRTPLAGLLVAGAAALLLGTVLVAWTRRRQ
jgi:type VI secretion system secreted protein VgrG